jgi:phosphoribosylanthranilate isomerase
MMPAVDRERTRVKICGLCRPADALAAARAGADYLGFVFAPSPRRAPLELAPELDRALGQASPERVGVFVLPPASAQPPGAAATAGEMAVVARTFRLDLLQLHGSLTPALAEAIRAAVGLPWILAVRAGEDDPRSALGAAPFALLFDTPHPAGEGGGSGHPFDWELARPWGSEARLFLAGGLTPGNVGQAIERVRPFAVDVASGVEETPGVKSAAAIADFVAAVRSADRARARATERT